MKSAAQILSTAPSGASKRFRGVLIVSSTEGKNHFKKSANEFEVYRGSSLPIVDFTSFR